MDKNNLEVVNVSGSVPMVGSTRHNSRGSGGKFKPKQNRIVGPLGPAGGVGDGGIDAVTGRHVGGRNHAVLHDLERVHAVTTRPHFEVPDWSRGVDPDRKSHDYRDREQGLNHILGCRTCATGGACT